MQRERPEPRQPDLLEDFGRFLNGSTLNKTVEQFATVSPYYCGMLRFAQSYPFRRALVSILYCLIFAVLSAMPFGLSTAHWIARTYGIPSLLLFLVAYTVVMTLLFWLVNRVNDAAPTFNLPPGGNLSVGPPIEEAVKDTELSLETIPKTAQSQQK
jgi:ABC-type transport system involved in multi-copper enzyme maturation permease subunit